MARLNAMDTTLHQFHKDKEALWTTTYNTEQSEWLHIDFTKKAYHASNFKDKSKQMTTWLECQEAIHQHVAFIDWCKSGFPVLVSPSSAYLHWNLMLSAVLTAYPSKKGITFECLFTRYRALDFQDALADFIVRHTVIIWNSLLLYLRGMVITLYSPSKGFPCSTRSSSLILRMTIQGLLMPCTSDQRHTTFVAIQHQGDLILHLRKKEANFGWFKFGLYFNSQDLCVPWYSLVHGQLLPQTWHM